MHERVPILRATVMPGDMNPYGGAFAGWIIGQMALGAASLAARHCAGRAIVVAANDLHFPVGLVCGDELSIYVDLVEVGRTSMIITAEAHRRERYHSSYCLCASGKFVFVSVDDNNRPRPVEGHIK